MLAFQRFFQIWNKLEVWQCYIVVVRRVCNKCPIVMLNDYKATFIFVTQRDVLLQVFFSTDPNNNYLIFHRSTKLHFVYIYIYIYAQNKSSELSDSKRKK